VGAGSSGSSGYAAEVQDQAGSGYMFIWAVRVLMEHQDQAEHQDWAEVQD
jgi:hypothetical protein